MAAAYPDKEEISKLLIEAGADESVRNKKGETARQITERIKRESRQQKSRRRLMNCADTI